MPCHTHDLAAISIARFTSEFGKRSRSLSSHPPAGGGYRLDELGDRIAHPHFLQKLEGGTEHLFRLRFGERAVGAARESRPYRTLALFQSRGASGDPGGPSS